MHHYLTLFWQSGSLEISTSFASISSCESRHLRGSSILKMSIAQLWQTYASIFLVFSHLKGNVKLQVKIDVDTGPFYRMEYAVYSVKTSCQNGQTLLTFLINKMSMNDEYENTVPCWSSNKPVKATYPSTSLDTSFLCPFRIFWNMPLFIDEF